MKKVLCWLPTVLLMIIIFFLSQANGIESSEMSHGVGDYIVDKLDGVLSFFLTEKDSFFNIKNLDKPIRKAAHISEYCMLSISLGYSLYISFELRGKVLFFWMEILTLIYACTDEFHQLFVMGRQGKIFDVLIDGIGGLFGVFIIYLILKNKKSRRQVYFNKK